MIPLHILDKIDTVYVHRQSMTTACADGRGSAYILQRALPRAQFHEVAYDSHAHRTMPATPGTLLCDLSPHRDRVKALRSAGAVVLDHHASAKDVVQSFEYHVFADEKHHPGVSGAVLAYDHVFQPLLTANRVVNGRQSEDLRELAILLGIRDTWQKNHPLFEEASELSAYVQFVPLSALVNHQPRVLMGNAQDLGPTLRAKTLDDAHRAIETGTRLKVGGHQLVLFNNTNLSSDALQFAHPEEVVVGYDMIHDGGDVRIQFSLRCRNGLDLTKVVAPFGGGGHTSAAGFNCKRGDWKVFDPLELILAAFSGT